MPNPFYRLNRAYINRMVLWSKDKTHNEEFAIAIYIILSARRRAQRKQRPAMGHPLFSLNPRTALRLATKYIKEYQSIAGSNINDIIKAFVFVRDNIGILIFIKFNNQVIQVSPEDTEKDIYKKWDTLNSEERAQHRAREKKEEFDKRRFSLDILMMLLPMLDVKNTHTALDWCILFAKLEDYSCLMPEIRKHTQTILNIFSENGYIPKEKVYSNEEIAVMTKTERETLAIHQWLSMLCVMGQSHPGFTYVMEEAYAC